MSVSVDPCASPPAGTLSCYVTTATCGCHHLSASGAAPTPLYHEYQERFGLTAFMITIIFATYVLSFFWPYSRSDRYRIILGAVRRSWLLCR
jgi:hypothetical protein